MDTFMEKLAERFTAQEMIKANTAAEQEEVERLKAQVQEYTACLDRMKQICVQMEQSADLAKSKMESAQLDTDGLKAELLKMWEDMQASMADKVEATAPAQEDDATERLNTQMASMDARLSKQSEQMEALGARMDAGLGAQITSMGTQISSIGTQISSMGTQLDAKLVEQLDDVVDTLNAQMDTKLGAQAETLRNAQSTGLEALTSVMERQIAGLQSGLDARLAQIAGTSQGIQPEEIRGLQAEQFERIRGLQDEQLNHIRSLQQDQLDSLRSVMKAQLSGLKDGQNQSDFIMGELESQRNTLDTKLEEIKSGVSEQLSGSNDFVHRECVKVYRNVQAVIGEENSKQTENLDYSFKPMKDNLKKVFTVSVVALVASIVGVLLQILSMLHIF
ncbi:MAG: hypothetical protein IJ794_02685 [Lachnospiraceae bacterium]|nr:hypothetical protein [Lachnospiraceae bacterium]